MTATLHITNGDGAGDCLLESGVPGDVLVCREVLYTGNRSAGWPDRQSLLARSHFLAGLTGGGMNSASTLEILERQYFQLSAASEYENIVLWFDACLCDQSMLVHILACLNYLGIRRANLICIDCFPGIEPFNGLGQLNPAQFASLYTQRRPVTDEQFAYATVVDTAFAAQNLTLLSELSLETDAPLSYVPEAIRRWLEEQPDPETGLGKLEHLTMKAIHEGNTTPAAIFSTVAKADKSPQFWGDIDLWRTINSLAEREPPLVRIEGPAERLPQWTSRFKLEDFKIEIVKNH